MPMPINKKEEIQQAVRRLEDMIEGHIKETIYIVAGNHGEYLDYVNRKHAEDIDNYLKKYIYVKDRYALMGAVNISGFFIGTFRNRKDIEDIKVTILLSKRNPEDSANFINDFLT
jgi:hypothetical protein